MTLRKTLRVLVFFLATIFVLTCQEDHEVAERFHPSLDTYEVTDITTAGATLNGEVLQVGTSAIGEYGFVYGGTNPEIDRSDRVVVEGPIKQGTYSAFINRNLVNNQTYYVRAYARAADNSFTVYGQQVKFLSRGGSAPQIADFSPKTGIIGDTVLITGSGFSDAPLKNLIEFSDENAVVLKASQDSLWCIVPLNTPVGDNKLSVTVGQLTAQASEKFHLKTMTFVSFSPDTVTFGDTVLISGTNFPRPSDISSVSLLGHQAVYISATSTSIQAIVSNDVNIHESPVSVKAGVQDISSSESIILHKPIVNGFSPSKGTLGTQITITGDYFHPVASKNKVEINGTATVPVQAKRNELTVKVPAGIEPGKYPLSLTVVNQSVVTTDLFEIVSPSITAITPLNGTWGSTITISGENFGVGINDNIVTFGTAQATVISTSDTELKVQVPDNLLTKSCLISVKAVTTDNQTVTFSNPFLLDPPTITGFSPEEGKSNSLVTITGANFNPVPGNHVVTFGSAIADVVSSSSNQLVVRVPAEAIDSEVSVNVDVAEQQATSSTFFHIVAPWRRIADIPQPMAYAVSFTIQDQGYVMAVASSGEKTSWRYSAEQDEWTQVASFSYVRYSTFSGYFNLSSFTIGDYGYAGMGRVNEAPVPEMSKYDPSSDSWTAIQRLGDGDSTGLSEAVSFGIGGKGYVTCGIKFQAQRNNYTHEYDPITDTWQRKADFPEVGRTHASVFTIATRAYLTCGHDGTWNNDLWEYETTTDTWKRLSDLPAEGRSRATTFAIGSRGYLLGGVRSSARFSDMWMYEADTGTWKRLPDFPGQGRYYAVAFTIGDKAYYGSGATSSNGTGLLKDFWEFDPSKL